MTDDQRDRRVALLPSDDTGFRIRTGNYRVVYEIGDDSLVVLIHAVRPPARDPSGAGD